MSSVRYPQLRIRSKNELAKRLADKSFSQAAALALINDALDNFEKYWYDSKHSETEKEKFIRSAIGTPLGQLLALIDRRLLKPYDALIPNCIFGGVSGRSHVAAARQLLGRKRRRTELSLDLKRFFEHIESGRVFAFFHKKTGCSLEASKILTRLCCVPLGSKQNPQLKKSVARGFPTSQRLSVWCNVETFMRLRWETMRKLKGHDARIVVFVDDIGISASNVTLQEMEAVRDAATTIFANQGFELHPDKVQLKQFSAGVEHLGLVLGRNKISMGRKAVAREMRLRNSIKQASGSKRKKLLVQRKSYLKYRNQIRAANQSA